MCSPGFDEFIGVSCEHDWAVIALNGKTMKGEIRWWVGSKADLARWVLAGLCSLDLLLLVSSRVLLPFVVLAEAQS